MKQGNRLNRLIKRAISVLVCPLDSVKEAGILNNSPRPLHETLKTQSSSFSNRHPQCKKERHREVLHTDSSETVQQQFITVHLLSGLIYICVFYILYIGTYMLNLYIFAHSATCLLLSFVCVLFLRMLLL